MAFPELNTRHPNLDLSAVLSDPADDDETHVRNLVYLLTCLLANTQCGPAERMPNDLNQRIWSSLSVLLNLGMGEDGRHPTVAAAGHFDITGTRISVVAQNKPPPEPQEEGAKMEVTEVESRGVYAGWKVLVDPNWELVVPFAEHVAQVLSIMTYLLNAKGDLPYGSIEPLLINFTVCRTYLKTCMRLENGYRVFLDHPLRIFHEFFQDPSRAEAIRDRTFITRSRAIKAVLEKAGIAPILEEPPAAGENPPAPPSRYQLNRHNVHLWTQVLLECLVNLENVHLRREGQRTEYRLLDTDEKRGIVRINLHILDAMLDKYGIIDGLMTPALEEEFEARYDQLIRSQNSHRNDPESDYPIVDAESEDEDTASETAAVFVREPYELPSEHVRRYLKSLTLPYTAPCMLVAATRKARLMKVGSDISMSVISVSSAPAPSTATDMLDRIERQLETSFTPAEYAAARARFNEYRKNKIRPVPSVHAEAALMGVANANAQGVLDKGVQTLDGLHDVSVGVDRKCCYTCVLLGRVLNEWRQERSMRSTFPTFILPGSHAVVYPWVPPPQGIPLEVLRKMRDELLKVFHEVIREGLLHHECVP